MSFFKNARKSANWLLNKSHNTIHTARNANRWMLKQLGKAHNGYRSIKHKVEKEAPVTKLLFDALEGSEYGVAVNTLRKGLKDNLKKADILLSTADSITKKRGEQVLGGVDRVERDYKRAKNIVSEMTRDFAKK